MTTRNDELFISVDIEASGPYPPEYSMLSIGACLVGDDTHTFYAEFQPISDKVVEAAIKVVGIPFDHFREEGREPARVMADLKAWLEDLSGQGRPVMVGFNAAFDWSFVNWYFLHHLGSNPFGIAPLDIKAYFMGMTGSAWKDTRVRRIPKEFHGEIKRSHHALKDARAQAQMFARMMEENQK